MKLNTLIKNIHYIDCVNFSNHNITNLSCDSKTISKDGLFFAIKGDNFDGCDFVCDSIKNGCVCVVTDKLLDVKITQIIVKNVRKTMALVSKLFFGNSDEKLKIIGIIGTNGKTTTSSMIYNVLKDCHINVGLIGTNGIFINDLKLPNPLTTPDPIDLHYTLKQMVAFGTKIVIIEISAHAISLHKTDGIVCDIGVFTNLSPEHLDYFKTMGSYAQTKCNYFCSEYMKECVVNVDDKYGKEIAYNCEIPCVSYGFFNPANTFAIDIKTTLNGSSFVVNVNDDVFKVSNKFVGDYNVYNALACISVLKMLNIPSSQIIKSFKTMNNIDGRWQVFDFKNNNKVIVDFAHTPDGFEKVLSIIKLLRNKGKIITLFGCVGYSNKQKRKEMGKIASKYSNFIILTTDNLCGENFENVCSDISPSCECIQIEDRQSAVEYGIKLLNSFDTLVLLGKGNEEVQKDKYNSKKYNEIEVVKALQKRNNVE